MSFVDELRRRNVIRVALAYMAGAWLVMQVADTLIDAYLWPRTWLGVVTTVLAVGFIPAIIVAWAFELTPEGIKRDEDAVSKPDVSAVRRFDRMVTVALALAVVYFVIDEIYFERVVTERSLAVLPFENLGGDDSQLYFADGVAGDVLQTLSEDRNLKVTSWSTSKRYRGNVDVAAVADELDVSYIVEGSVQRAGGSIRVAARLIDVVADAVIWAEDWDRELVDVFVVQDDIATKVARNLRVELIKRHRDARKTDPETYDLYLQARKFWYESELNRSDRTREIELLEQALQRDPDFVPAMTLLARVLQTASRQRVDEATTQAYSQRRMELIDRAYELDPEDGLATAYAGWNASMRSGDLFKGIPYLETALRLEPSNPDILLSAAFTLKMLGRIDDALMLIEESIRRHPNCQHCYARLGQFNREDNRYEAAQEAYRRRLALETDTLDYGAHVNIAMLDIRLGNYDAALAAIEEYEPSEVDRMILQASIADRQGRHEEADRLIAETRERLGDNFYRLAEFYAGREDVEQTLNWAGQYVKTGDFGVVLMLTDRHFEFAFDTPQWQGWLRDFGLHPEQIAGIEFDIPEFD